MNERINDIRLQAGISRLKDEPKFMVAVSEENKVIEPLVGLEKFAELIVLECVRYFNEDYQRDFDTLWREDLSKGIKEHFGVE
jgi:hypothetical protein